MARRLIAAWHKLFTPPQPSPALETFLVWLAATPYQWYLNPDGKLRARAQGAEVCAVTGVVRHRAGGVYGLGDWVRAADRIGISYADAGLVVEAADRPGSSNALVTLLRKRLLTATGIESSPAASSIHDSMDQALADLVASRTETAGLGPLRSNGSLATKGASSRRRRRCDDDDGVVGLPTASLPSRELLQALLHESVPPAASE